MGELTLFLPLLIIMGAFMFFASRRQKKAMQATINLHDSLKVGDDVMTTAGLFGTIAGISDARVDLEIAPGVVVSMLKLAIKDVVTAEDDDLDDEDEDDDEVEYEADDADEAEDAEDYELEEASAAEIDRSATGSGEVKTVDERLTKD